MSDAAWDGRSGTAGGESFGAALVEVARERDVPADRLAREAFISEVELSQVCSGKRRVAVATLACFAASLRLKPIEFLQRMQILSLDVYAYGLDPLYFLPEGPTRYDARIYMREINPRHQVPEGDMTRRNSTLKAIAEDEMLDAVGKLELELAYLLRTAAQQTGGTL